MQDRIVATEIHGRYLAIPAAATGQAPLLVGFHGYGEDAQIQLERLQAIPGSDLWLKVSIQALHRFYQRRTNQVGASWMTREDREIAIADNIAYVSKCIGAISNEWHLLPVIVFAGFSQGVAMAFRAAVRSPHGKAAVIAVGGDIPPEIVAADLSCLSAALIARGTSDGYYSEEQFGKDEQRLRRSSVDVHALSFNGGHEWSGEVIDAASRFLRERLP